MFPRSTILLMKNASAISLSRIVCSSAGCHRDYRCLWSLISCSSSLCAENAGLHLAVCLHILPQILVEVDSPAGDREVWATENMCRFPARSHQDLQSRWTMSKYFTIRSSNMITLISSVGMGIENRYHYGTGSRATVRYRWYHIKTHFSIPDSGSWN